MRLLDLVHRTLADRGVPHALVGAAALAACGIARSTFDVDLLVVDRQCLEDKFWTGLRTGTVTVEVRRGDSDDPLAGVVRIYQPEERPVDVVVGRHAWQHGVIERALGRPESPAVVQAADLVLLKLHAGGSQDLWDVDQLLALPGSESRFADINARIDDLPVEARHRWTRIIDARSASGLTAPPVHPPDRR